MMRSSFTRSSPIPCLIDTGRRPPAAMAAVTLFSPPLCWSRLCRVFYAHTPALVRPRLNRRLFSRTRDLWHQKSLYRTRNVSGKVLCNQVKLEDVVHDEACELVNGVDLIIGEGQDSIHAYLLKPVKNNNETGVLILSDEFGFEDSSTRDFAYRVACTGYNVLVPDLFHGNPWKKGRPSSEFEQWLSGQSLERVSRDIDASAKWFIDEFEAAGLSKKLGIVGFSYGAERLIETLARDEAENFVTGVSFYGANWNASLAKDIKVPVLFICGDNDPLCRVSELRDIEKSIGDSRLVVYSGRGHGFAHRPESLEEDEDAEKAFAVMRNWLQDTLLASMDGAE